MVKLENKFVVINRKKIMNPDIVPRKKRAAFFFALYDIMLHLDNHQYYVCNQDEPYADKVWKIILDGENAKKQVKK